MSDIKIKIDSLYKIFGKNPKEALEHVKQGVGKDELLEKHNHVLGLSDINIDIVDKSIQVIMGLSGSGKSTLASHLLSNIPSLSFSVSSTTREKRKNEIHGKNYYFISSKNFKENINSHKSL